MRYLIPIISTAAAVVLSSGAATTPSVAKQTAARDVAIPSSAPARSGTAAKLVMGPTSAPQKPGGVGQEPQQIPKLHGKAKHKHTAS
jgi:hypothetical protein